MSWQTCQNIGGTQCWGPSKVLDRLILDGPSVLSFGVVENLSKENSDLQPQENRTVSAILSNSGIGVAGRLQ